MQPVRFHNDQLDRIIARLRKEKRVEPVLEGTEYVLKVEEPHQVLTDRLKQRNGETYENTSEIFRTEQYLTIGKIVCEEPNRTHYLAIPKKRFDDPDLAKVAQENWGYFTDVAYGRRNGIVQAAADILSTINPFKRRE